MDIYQRVKGAIAGMVYGDSFGVPGELWPREKLHERFGTVNTFLDGPEDNIVACYFKAGQYTDDSSQAFVILNLLLKNKTIPSVEDIATKLIEWVESLDGFNINLLGPSSKATLLAHKNHEDYTQYTKLSLTNGAAMRIAPVGCIFKYGDFEKLAQTVAGVSIATHNTDVAIAGASMVAQAVCSGVNGRTYDEMIDDVCRIHDISYLKYGERTWAASCKQRFLLGVDYAKKCTNDQDFMNFVYEVIGTGTMTSESVSAALCIAYYCKDPNKAAFMCANLGGDTDTIGAMAVAICGAFNGYDSIDRERIEFIKKTNNLDIDEIAKNVVALRETFEV